MELSNSSPTRTDSPASESSRPRYTVPIIASAGANIVAAVIVAATSKSAAAVHPGDKRA